jgi:hypothetical protein
MNQKNFCIHKGTEKGLIILKKFGVLLFIPTILLCSTLMCKKEKEIWVPSEVIPGPEQHPPELLELAEEFRALRGGYHRRWHPGWGNGDVPDYAAVAQKQKEQLPKLRARLDALDPTDWSMHCKIDYLLLRAEMDQLEWELYVIRQTSRNPSFYVDQAIGNVRRHLTGGRRMGDNPKLMPYNKERAQAILQALANTEKILAQGRKNLTEMVPELAEVAFRHPGGGHPTKSGELKYIIENYRKWAKITAEHFPEPEAKKLVSAAIKAAQYLLEFGKWIRC